ncbi:hypothetical protein LTR24_010359 [Lithohypha guttulata]|uniref:Amidase domain-containing protein n=1 Tax=Lithohypha guttulata TaxID=1690604 RepID=A0ABR0JU52_9EURO|nr:hypothetical protein LTR24_010359 [Lithohypha guttulata]
MSPRALPYNSAFDLLTTTACDLQERLENGTTTSEALVRVYLNQIHKHNVKGMGLRAMISVRSEEDLLRVARELDSERKSKGSRGPLHGIPVIVKDTYNTPSIGLETTCGSFALKGAVPREDAAVVKRALEVGMIILGKTNLSELGNFKGIFNTAGWSAVDGQTLSPYVRGGVLADGTFLGHSTPSGSSSGSCVGVAAGFAPVALGAQTDGSVVQPASRAALFALKMTPALADCSGTQPGNSDFDSLGVMSKSATDILNLWNYVLAPASDKIARSQLPSDWKDLRVGFVDPYKWQPADFVTGPNEEFRKQSISELNDAAHKIGLAGSRVVRDVDLVQTPQGFDDLVVDVIMAPSDSRLVSVASAAGCPVANVPLGFARFNGRAHGLNVIARPRDERALLQVMLAWQGTFPEALAPPPMMTGAISSL